MSRSKKRGMSRAERLFKDHGVILERMPQDTNTKIINPKKGDPKKDRRRFKEELKQYYSR